MLTPTFRISLITLFLLKWCFVSYSQEKNDDVNIVQEYKIIGNKTTKDKIILRELPFNIGDTIKVSELDKVLKRAKSNLLNTSLFNFVTVQPVYFDDTYISIYITVEERWYWWPIPIFDIAETNFNTWWLNKDFDKVNYGLFLSKENFRGRKENIMFLFQTGYTEKIGVKYVNPYINREKTNGLSIQFSYGRNHETTYSTTNNVRDYYRSNDDYIQEEISTKIGYEFRPKLYNFHFFEAGYSNINVADSVVLLNDNFLAGSKKSMQYLSLNYILKRDKRNEKNYPTEGYYYDFRMYKNGLGLLDSELNSLYMTSQIKRFWKFTNRLYFAGSLKAKVTIKEGPYYLYGGLGFRSNLVRGYELYLINGEHYSLVKTQLRYAMIKNKIFKVNAISAEKFNKIPLQVYVGAFFDSGYVDSNVNTKNNYLQNTALYGGGFSLDFVSYYDMVLRIEYAMNKMKESGLFLHFVAPI